MILHIPVNVTASGYTELVAAQPGLPITVQEWLLVSSAAASVKFADTAGDLTGPMAFAENGGAQQAYHKPGHFSTHAGEPLRLHSSATSNIGGTLIVSIP